MQAIDRNPLHMLYKNKNLDHSFKILLLNTNNPESQINNHDLNPNFNTLYYISSYHTVLQ